MPAVVIAAKAFIAYYGVAYTVGFVIGRVLLYVAISYVANRIGRLFTKTPSYGSTELASQNQAVTVREPAASQKIIYGQTRVGGVIVYIGSSGTNKEYMHLVVAHAGHECEEIGTVYLNDEVVPLDGSGNATGKFAGYVTIKKHLGSTSQTYDTDLAAAMGSEWTSNHRLRGICYSYIRLKFSQDLFPSGIPNYSALIKGKKCYDPRTATTVWTQNAAIILRDYLTDTRLGLGATSGEIDDAAVTTAANICDESVNLNPAGTEARYTINGVVDTATQPGSVIQDMVGAMAGMCPYISGQFKMKAGAHTSSVHSLTLDDSRGPLRFTTGDSMRDSFNGVKGVYISSKNAWQPADFPPVVNSTYTTEDGGVRVWRDISLPFTSSSATAQRLAKIELERSRRDNVVQFQAKLTALNVQVGDVIDLTIARYGWTNKLFEVVDFVFVVVDGGSEAPSLGIDLTLRATDSSVWSWSSSEEVIVYDTPGSTIHDPSVVATPATPTLSTSNFVQPDGTISPRLQVQVVLPADDFVQRGGLTHIEYKKAADSDWIYWGAIRGPSTETFITDVLTNTSYNVRAQFQNTYGVKGSYSPTATATVSNDVTAPATPTGLSAVSGPGCVVLDWNDNTESDLDRYEVYRNTTNTFPGGTPLWTGYASQHADFSGTVGVTYYYWLKAADTSDNLSAQTSSVNAAPASTTGAAGGYSEYWFKRSASAPSTPTGDTPAGWYDAPPAGSDPLYFIVGDKTGGGTLVGTWSTPVRIDGPAGADGDGVEFEYSVDGSTSWHGTFTGGDLYARHRVGTGSWTAAYKIVGEDGAPGAGATFDLTMLTSGAPDYYVTPYGTNTYNAGDLVAIWADPSPAGGWGSATFVQWSGSWPDIDYVQTPGSNSTYVLMVKDTTLTADFI